MKSWPQWSENFVKSGFPKTSLLAGTEPAIWDALGRLELEDFNNGKQVVVRKALYEIGLGWVATNTTPFRIVVGALFDAAEKCFQDNLRNTRPVNKRIPAIHVETRELTQDESPVIGPISKCTVAKANRDALWEQLESYGGCIVRQAIEASELSDIPETKEANKTKLAQTMGNGIAGHPPSVYMEISQTPKWLDTLEQNLANLLIAQGFPENSATLKRKSILLLAGPGAENWAHQDNNDETPPLQAVLMLSRPKRDFAGGEFYIAKQTKNTKSKINIIRYKVSFESPGDLVVFKAGKNSGWWHGMLPVRVGSIEKLDHEHLRKAVGMLQPA